MVKKIFNKITRKNYYIALGVICLLTLVLFFPSLFTFYTNDDFFHLRLANVSSLGAFINFFNLLKSPEGWGLYRPLTTQVFYFLTVKLFNLNPLPLHIISFVTLFIIIYLVGELTILLTGNRKVAIFAALLYATSATHFGHLYFLGTYQELGMALFFLLSIICFFKDKTIISLLFFILAIMSKETALVLPFILVLIQWYLKKKFNYLLLPYFVVGGVYLFLRFRYFGFASGDSYVWNFSPLKAINTLGWYGLWSFNIPETLVDFIGPGLHLNPNLLKYWAKEIIPIFILFVLQMFIIFGLLVKSAKKLVLFSLFWFVITLGPVLFLPIHKFTYYLTLPLIGVVIFVSNLILSARVSRVVAVLFILCWLTTSYFTISLTRTTNWITTGASTAKRVYDYFSQNQDKYIGKTIVFYDTPDDANLPWSPTQVVKVVLSDNNFFDVFFPQLASKISYSDRGEVGIGSRQFLGY